jgi:hypothetical protein
MATKGVQAIMEDVRIALDRNNCSCELFDDIDTTTLDDIIKSNIVKGVRAVHAVAPYYMLEQGHNMADADTDTTEGTAPGLSIYWNGDEYDATGKLIAQTGDTFGYVALPKDFQRLVVFQLSDWERPVYNAISVDDPEYAKQRSRFKGIRGTAQKPVCAIGVRPEGLVLEFYSCKSRSVTVKRAVYIPLAEIDAGDNVDLSERCYAAIVYKIAALTLFAIGEGERGKLFEELSKAEFVQ